MQICPQSNHTNVLRNAYITIIIITGIHLFIKRHSAVASEALAEQVS